MCVFVGMRVSFQREEQGAALTEASCPPAPAQACFLPELLMSLQLQKPGDL